MLAPGGGGGGGGVGGDGNAHDFNKIRQGNGLVCLSIVATAMRICI